VTFSRLAGNNLRHDSTHSPMSTALNRPFLVVFGLVERYLLPLIFFGLACRELASTWFVLDGYHPAETTVFLDSSHHIVLLLLDVITGVALLIGFRAAAPATDLKSIFIPLTATFFPFVYYGIQLFPPIWRNDLYPPGCQKSFVIAGLTCIIIGPLMALWGLLYLGRSFGIYVTLRKVVLSGPYRWVRHPMYLGWFIIYVGVALTKFSAVYLLLIAIQLALMFYRAFLEENHLAENSPEYREYMKHSGFIFPRLRRPAQNRSASNLKP
jgi:protein-S-isoprenylcysteine O-methyltransferase Ste14